MTGGLHQMPGCPELEFGSKGIDKHQDHYHLQYTRQQQAAEVVVVAGGDVADLVGVYVDRAYHPHYLAVIVALCP